MNTKYLARLRKVAERNMAATATIKRLTKISDGAGGYSQSWATASSPACAASTQMGQAEQQLAARLSIVNAWVVRLPAATDVRPADRLVIGSDTLEVVHASAGTWETVRMVLCRQIDTGATTGTVVTRSDYWPSRFWPVEAA